MSDHVNGAGLTPEQRQRYSVSVSLRTYERLRAVVPGNLAGFVDELVEATLDDPALLSRLVAKCCARQEGS